MKHHITFDGIRWWSLTDGRLILADRGGSADIPIAALLPIALLIADLEEKTGLLGGQIWRPSA